MRSLAILLGGTLLWAGPIPAAAQGAAPVAAPAVAAAASQAVAPAVEQLQAAALTYAETQAAGLAGSYVFRVIKPPLLPRNPGGDLRFEPSHLSKRDLSGHFFASFKATLDGRPLGMVRVDLEGKWTGRLWRTRTSLARKAVPDENLLEAVDFAGIPPAGAISDLPAGMRLRAQVPTGHLLVLTDLEPIPVILAGERVRLELVDGALVVAVETIARSNGAVGERIRLEMPSSRKPLVAMVKGPGEAQAQWGGSK